MRFLVILLFFKSLFRLLKAEECGRFGLDGRGPGGLLGFDPLAAKRDQCKDVDSTGGGLVISGGAGARRRTQSTARRRDGTVRQLQSLAACDRR